MTGEIRIISIAATALLLAGCAGGAIPRPATPSGPPPPAAATPPPTTRPPVTQPRITQNNALVGHGADNALRMFGKPRLDVSEGAARKLQFAGAACILDIYYYAPRAGADPVATHVDARTPDGRDANVPSCIDALRR